MNGLHFPSNRLPPKDQLIMGLHAIDEVLQYAPDRLLKIFTSSSHAAQNRKSALLAKCKTLGLSIECVPEELLTKMAGSDSHQSIVAHIKGRKFYDAMELIEETNDQEKTFLLMLSEIFDPQNFGAILRSAECFGVDGVIWSKNRGCDLTPLVSKASCGASELLRLTRISNLADAVDKLKSAGFEIVASLVEPNALPLDQFSYSSKTVLIIGSEGEGIQPLLRKKANRSVYISLSGKIKSLNAAQATAVLLSRRNVTV